MHRCRSRYYARPVLRKDLCDVLCCFIGVKQPAGARIDSLHHTFLLGAAGEQEENGPRAGRSSGAGVPDGMPTDTQSSAYRSKAGHAKSYGWAPESSGEDGGADRCAVDCVSLEPCRAARARALGCLRRRAGEYPPARLLHAGGRWREARYYARPVLRKDLCEVLRGFIGVKQPAGARIDLRVTEPNVLSAPRSCIIQVAAQLSYLLHRLHQALFDQAAHLVKLGFARDQSRCHREPACVDAEDQAVLQSGLLQRGTEFGERLQRSGIFDQLDPQKNALSTDFPHDTVLLQALQAGPQIFAHDAR